MNLLNKNRSIISVLALVCFLTSFTYAEQKSLSCPNFFSDHMVLQRGKTVAIWGKSIPKSEVNVKFAGQSKKIITGDNGEWKAILDSMEASSENRVMEITSGDKSIVFKNVLVGEVWIASGQSNMQWTLPRSNMPKDELAKLNKPLVRMVTFSRVISKSPKYTATGTWEILDAKSGPRSSAVASFFAMKLQTELNIPIGIISTSWGGTRIEPWTPAEGFDLVKELAAQAKEVREMDMTPQQKITQVKDRILELNNWLEGAEKAHLTGGKLTLLPEIKSSKIINNRSPGAIYNAMVKPIVGLSFRGAIWYQGESNVGDGLLYEKKMQALIGGWRKVWGQGDFPFYHVQLAPFGRYSGEKLAGIWEAQLHSTRSIVNTGMAVITDIGNLKNIHPVNKSEVGRRLALWALAKDYGKDVKYSGPLYKSFKIVDNKMVISFDHADGGLSFKGDSIKDVMIKGEGESEFVTAKPEIKGNELIVAHPAGKKPTHVRMGWNKNAQPNLTNKEGLPASPFRTDK